MDSPDRTANTATGTRTVTAVETSLGLTVDDRGHLDRLLRRVVDTAG